MRKKKWSVQVPVIYVVIIMIVGAVVVAVLSMKNVPGNDNGRVVPGNYYNSEVRSGSQVIEVNIAP